MRGIKTKSFTLLFLTALFMVTYMFDGILPVFGADSTTRIAKITEISGDVKVKKAGGEKTYPGFKGMGLVQGDKVMTGSDGRVTMELDKDKEVKIAPNTQIILSELVKSINSQSSKTTINLLGGKIVVHIKKKLEKDSKFSIKTSTAVAGVRGTRFYMSYEKGTADVAVLEGTVATSVSNYVEKEDGSRELQTVEVALNANEQATLDETAASKEDIVVSDVSLKSLDLFLLETIKEDPKGVSEDLTQGLDEAIEEKKQEAEQAALQKQQSKESENAEPQIDYAAQKSTNTNSDTTKTDTDSKEEPQDPYISMTPMDDIVIHQGEDISIEIPSSPADAVLTATFSNVDILDTHLEGHTLCLYGKSPGTSTVTITGSAPGYRSRTIQFSVTVKEPLPPIAISPALSQVSLTIGESKTINIETVPQEAQITALLADPNIADVQLSGKILTITAKAAGSALLTVTAESTGYRTTTMSTWIDILAPTPKITIDPISDIHILQGETAMVTPTLYPTDAFLMVNAKDTNIANAYIKEGKIIIEGKSPGTAVIEVSASKEGHESGYMTFNAVIAQPLPVVAIEAVGDILLTKGDSKTVVLNVNPTDAVLGAISHDTAVADVEISAGQLIITAKAPGTTTITITGSKAGYKDSVITIPIQVNEPQPSIVISPIGDYNLTVGMEKTIALAVAPLDADITVQSSDPNVAAVTSSGYYITLKAVSAGSTQITITANMAGYIACTAVFNVTVTEPIPSVTINPIADLNMTVGETSPITVETVPADAVITAESTDPGVASILLEGHTLTILGNAPGTATIIINATQSGYQDNTLCFTVNVTDIIPTDEAPTVIRPGRGQIFAYDPMTILFSEPLSEASKHQVQNTISYMTDMAQYLQFAWSADQKTLTVNFAMSSGMTNFAADVKCTIEDTQGNTTPDALLIKQGTDGRIATSGNPAGPYYRPGDTVTVEVRDTDGNIDPLINDSIICTVQNALTYEDNFTIILNETGPDTGVFIGDVKIGTSTDYTNNTIKGQPGEDITFYYSDEFAREGYTADFATYITVVSALTQTAHFTLPEGYTAQTIDIIGIGTHFSNATAVDVKTASGAAESGITHNVGSSSQVTLSIGGGLISQESPYTITLNTEISAGIFEMVRVKLFIRDTTAPTVTLAGPTTVKIRSEAVQCQGDEPGIFYLYPAEMSINSEEQLILLMDQNQVRRAINYEVGSIEGISTTGLQPGQYQVCMVDVFGNLSSNTVPVTLVPASNITAIDILDSTYVKNVDTTNYLVTTAYGTLCWQFLESVQSDGGNAWIRIFTDATRTTEIDFNAEITNGMTIEVMAEDIITKQTYTAIVLPPSDITDIQFDAGYSYYHMVDNVNHVISLSYDTTAGELKYALKVDEGRGTFTIYTDASKTSQPSDTDYITDSMIIEATAQDGVTKQIYTIQYIAV